MPQHHQRLNSHLAAGLQAGPYQLRAGALVLIFRHYRQRRQTKRPNCRPWRRKIDRREEDTPDHLPLLKGYQRNGRFPIVAQQFDDPGFARPVEGRQVQRPDGGDVSRFLLYFP
jgi:hypothetical protein